MGDKSPGTEPPVPPTPLPPVNPTEPPPGNPIEPPPGNPAEPTPVPPTPPAPEPTQRPPGSIGISEVDSAGVDRDYTVPTMDDVRAKIEGRFARAGGQAELDAASAEGRQQANSEEARAKAAQEALDRIRASLHND